MFQGSAPLESPPLLLHAASAFEAGGEAHGVGVRCLDFVSKLWVLLCDMCSMNTGNGSFSLQQTSVVADICGKKSLLSVQLCK